MLNQIPLELLQEIINKLSYREAVKLLSVNKYYHLINYEKIKNSKYILNFKNIEYIASDLDIPLLHLWRRMIF